MKPLLLILIVLLSFCFPGKTFPLGMVCQPDNDLYQTCVSNSIPVQRFDNMLQVMKTLENGQALLVLADEYPQKTVTVKDEWLKTAEQKQFRLYIEYPENLPSFKQASIMEAGIERGVITSDFFGDSLQPMRIVMVHGCHYLPFQVENPMMVLARVAGFDKAVYGLEETETIPLLFKLEDSDVLVATSKLSNFITGRYAPSEAWRTIWISILQWLDPNLKITSFDFQSGVRPEFAKKEPLLEDVEKQSLEMGIDWVYNSRMLIDSSWVYLYDKYACQGKEPVAPAISTDMPCGDGSLGLLEGFQSTINYDGSQKVRWWRRFDCHAEIAGSMGLAYSVSGNTKHRQTAFQLTDYIITRSLMSGGNRADVNHPAFGLFGWHDVPNYYKDLDGYEVYYGDDNARGILGVLAAAAALETDKWDERILQCLLGNLRTTGPGGFRHNRLNEPDLEKHGWQYYFEQETTSYAPHYQAYLWACYLWAYHKTGYDLFLNRAKSAIKATMEVYPGEWTWTNGMQQERARMLLPLSWLVRIEDTPEHRAWLKQIAGDLLACQHETGAIREAIGEAGHGKYFPPVSNAHYGTTEAPLIQENGDMVCDLLYTTNFAFLGLHEAASVTGDDFYKQAEERLAKFLCRIQVHSTAHPELHGAWFRAFDFNRWEYWASNADAGWGAWCTETGWTQGWITMVLALRQMDTSFWEFIDSQDMQKHFQKNKMLKLGNR